jgi:MerR family transcriptional regulator, light-induced transcriptional regulator
LRPDPTQPLVASLSAGRLIEVDAPLLSAGDVARRVGVAVSTLRTWDRRYGLGPSVRQPGRHRRYARQDVERLLLMQQLVHDGVLAAEAARVARQPGGIDDLTAAQDARPLEISVTAAHAARGLGRAALALDIDEVERIIRAALDRGVVAGWTEVICPAMRSVEQRYVTTGQYIDAEHLLSSAVSAALNATVRPARSPDVLLACAADELHTLPLEALAAALAEAGRRSRMLGARVPPQALQHAIARSGPTAVVLWAHSAATAQANQLQVVTGARPRPALIAACGPGWDAATLPQGIARPANLASAVAAVAALP